MRRAGDEVGCTFPVDRALPDNRIVCRAKPDPSSPRVGEPAYRRRHRLTSCVVRTCSVWLALLGVALIAGCPTQTGEEGNTNANVEPQRPKPPQAEFSHSVLDPVGAPSTVLFDARASKEGTTTDELGAAISIPISTYTWDFGDGSDDVRSDPFADHAYLAGGPYKVTLTLTDEQGQTAEYVLDIDVAEPPPVVPIAVLGANPTVGDAPLTVVFDASESDPGGADALIVSYSWDFEDGSPEDNAVAPTHVFEDIRTYEVSLTVINDAGDEATATVIIDARQPSGPGPTASIQADPVSGTAPLSVTFDGSGSTPGTSGGQIVEYIWEFDDGVEARGIDAIVPHLYVEAGSYVAKLTVIDDGGGSDSKTVLIQVNAGALERGLTSITVLPGQIALAAIGGSTQLAVTGHYSMAPLEEDLTIDSELMYLSSDPTVVTVSDTGLVEAKGLGAAVIAIRHSVCATPGLEGCAAAVAVTVGSELDVQIARDPAGELLPGSALTLTASTGGPIESITWSLTLGGNDATELLDPFDAPVTAVDISSPGNYVASCDVEDAAGQTGSAAISFAVTDLAGSLVVEAGDDIRAIPLSEDFGGVDDPFAVGALFTSGQENGLIEGLSGSASDSAHSVADATYAWTPFAIPAPVAGDTLSPPDVLIFTPNSPTTEFQIRPVPTQIAVRSSGLPGEYLNQVVPGEYSFLLTVTNPIGPSNGNVEGDTVKRTLTPGFEVLEAGVIDEAFEGVAIRTGFTRHRVIGPDEHLLEYAVLTRQTATLSFDLFDDGSEEDEQGDHDSDFFDTQWCSGGGGCVSDLASFELLPGTAATPIEPPSIKPLDVLVEAGSRGTYLIRAYLSDGAWVDTPATDRFPEDTGAVLHVQENLPSVIAITAAYEHTPFPHIGLVNSVTSETNTAVAPVAVHGARAPGSAPDWNGEKIISQDLNRDGFPEVIVMHDGKISMFSGLEDGPYDVTRTLAAPASAGATQLTLVAPFAPEETETYWIEITNPAAGGDCAWRWQTAAGDGTGAVGSPYEEVNFDLAFCLNPGAGEIICQNPNRGPHGTDGDFFSPDPVTADNFSMDESSSVETISWWGIYEGPDGPCTPPADGFQITFFSDEDGLPGTQLATYNVGAMVDRTLTGGIIDPDGDSATDDFPEYKYNATLALLAAIDFAIGDSLTIDADNGNAEVVSVTADSSASAQVEVTALSAAHPAGAIVQGYASNVADSASPLDNSKNNVGALDFASTTLVEIGDGTITDACFGDVNADGFVDLIVGRGSYKSRLFGSEGRVDIYFHSGDPTFGQSPYGPAVDVILTRPATERWRDESGAAGGDEDLFGYSVASADVTGDGIDDVLVGAPQAERASGVETEVEDVDGDDLLVTSADGFAAGDRILVTRGTSGAKLTTILAITPGDPGDPDRITAAGHGASVGASVQRFEETGAVFGFNGPLTSEANITVEDFDEEADEVDDRFFWFIPSDSDDGDLVGASVAVDSGTGPSRIILGAPGRDTPSGGTDAGAVFILNGGAALDTAVVLLLTQPTAQFEGDSAGLAFGRRVLSGHVTGTDQPDILASAAANTDLVGQSHTTAQGAVYLIPAGTESNADLAELPHMSGTDVPGGGARNHNLGASFALGDFDRDGFDDILITAPSVDYVNQRVFVVFGTPSLTQALSFDVTLIHESDVQFLNDPEPVDGAGTGSAILYKAGGCAWADANGDRILDLIFSGLTGSEIQAVMVAGHE